MLERLLLPENHAIAILLKDHDRVKRLFDELEKAKSSTQKEEVRRRASMRAVICAIVMLARSRTGVSTARSPPMPALTWPPDASGCRRRVSL